MKQYQQLQQEQEYERREHKGDLFDQTMSHPLDIRSDPSLRDPALVDLQPWRDAARQERIDAEQKAFERRRERRRGLI